jgi:hypothetical protein
MKKKCKGRGDIVILDMLLFCPVTVFKFQYFSEQTNKKVYLLFAFNKGCPNSQIKSQVFHFIQLVVLKSNAKRICQSYGN